jgi:hypothetical protein
MFRAVYNHFTDRNHPSVGAPMKLAAILLVAGIAVTGRHLLGISKKYAGRYAYLNS